jgi:hypothetical protein
MRLWRIKNARATTNTESPRYHNSHANKIRLRLMQSMQQEPYPEIRQKIDDRIQALRDAGVALSLMSIHATMIAFIEQYALHLFSRSFPDGSKFRCSEVFVQKYL